MNTVGIGFLGAGHMAERMAATIVKMIGLEVRAVAARDVEKAKNFAMRHRIAKAYGSYAELVEDPTIDLVYVATPNTSHYGHSKLCIEHGKHVLCEKPFAVTSAEASEVFALAKSRKLLATEAMWPSYMPFVETIRRMLRDGIVGDISYLTANIGNDVRHLERLCDPALGGGALLDLGVYALNFAMLFIEERPGKTTASRVLYETGVDAQNAIILSYPSGKMASLFTSMMVATDRRGILYGEKGYLEVENINNPHTARLFSPDRKLQETFVRPEQISGLEYEMAAAVKAVREGMTECAEMPHQATLNIIEQVENILARWSK